MQTYNAETDEATLVEAAPFLLRSVLDDDEVGAQRLSLVVFKFALAVTRHLSLSGHSQELHEVSALIERCIASIQRPKAAKQLILHHLQFLALNTTARSTTADRADRLITALRSIHDAVPGNAVRFYRLQIYRRLLDAAPALMEARLQDWLMVHAYASMFFVKPEIRQQACALVAGAALRFGPAVSKFAQGAFAAPVAAGSDARPFSDVILERLTTYLRHSEPAMALIVPRVFAATFLLLNASFKKFAQWQQFKQWWQLISQSFNSPHRQVRQESMMAWNCLIYVVMPDAHTFPQAKKMLRSPIEKQLAASSDLSSGVGRTTLSTYVCLLYYSLRPAATLDALDSYWPKYVAGMLVRFGTEGGDHRVHVACSVLQSLFRSSEVWREGRLHEPAPIEIEELPRVDARWIRSRLAKVLEVVEAFLVCPQAWGSAEDDVDNSVAVVTWRSLLESVREAGAKEVTCSSELKASIGAIVATMARIGYCLKDNSDKDNSGGAIRPAKAYNSLVRSALSILQFSNFSSKHHPKSKSQKFPILHIFDTMSALMNNPVDMDAGFLEDILKSTLEYSAKTENHFDFELIAMVGLKSTSPAIVQLTIAAWEHAVQDGHFDVSPELMEALITAYPAARGQQLAQVRPRNNHRRRTNPPSQNADDALTSSPPTSPTMVNDDDGDIANVRDFAGDGDDTDKWSTFSRTSPEYGDIANVHDFAGDGDDTAKWTTFSRTSPEYGSPPYRSFDPAVPLPSLELPPAAITEDELAASQLHEEAAREKRAREDDGGSGGGGGGGGGDDDHDAGDGRAADDGEPARKVRRVEPVAGPGMLLGRMWALVDEAAEVGWSVEEQLEAMDAAFQFQAAVRGHFSNPNSCY
jgi:hypothetical protein